MKRILVAPLDWGLGHASRCVPIIQHLLSLRCEVLIAGSGASLSLLAHEFPHLEKILLPPYNPLYPKNTSMVWAMARQLPHFVQVIRQEHRILTQLVAEKNINGVISDNRFGCWTNQVPCVFISHQSNILMPRRFGWLAPVVRFMTIRFMRKYSACWIPDYENNVLSGELSSLNYGDGVNAKFIGPLSRFKKRNESEKIYDVVAVLSGPEPQRSILEKELTSQLEKSAFRYKIVRGLPETKDSVKMNNSVDFLGAEDLQHLLEQTEVVIARSGYSTVMDMAALGKRAIFIPTPGQTEQEYLARRLKEKGVAYFMPQESFDLSKAMLENEKYSGFNTDHQSHQRYTEYLEKWLSILKV